jgi:hypothetical protein
MNTESPYLNRAAVKKLALQFARNNRAGKFTRVGASFFERLNSQVSAMIAAELKSESHPMYINCTAVKKLAENIAKNERLDTPINGIILDRINRKLIDTILNEVHRHPSVGKTLQ